MLTAATRTTRTISLVTSHIGTAGMAEKENGDADDDDAAVDAGGDAGDHADVDYAAHDDAQDLLSCIVSHGALGCTRMFAVQHARL